MCRKDRGHSTITSLLLAWQATGDDRRLEELLALGSPLIEKTVRGELHRQHIRDPAAADDAAALVFDHLRRLAGHRCRGRTVTPFRPAARHRGDDPGTAYVTWLASERARDVARALHRHARRLRSCTSMPSSPMEDLESCTCSPASDAEMAAEAAAQTALLQQAIDRLEPTLADVLRMLLAGKSQAAIAVRLRVCEGTVSRMRVRAIRQVREFVRPR